ncbi:TlpA family protein disulfide reductase [Maribacter litoralis]|uniref:Peroxiredoxin n=1 Tax=Maribacter litoralis TaxID=2059726 RepID=A0A653M9N0_9FLAO|nr:TlpA disulfide reductase family protein [Maribacter litoralis]VXB01648.1 Peroxiredoxin [Maribacter litoralis]
MKKLILLSIALIIIGCSDDKIIELPITMQDGYGPFLIGLGAIHPYSELDGGIGKETQLKVVGMPKDWTNVQVGDILTHQSDKSIKNRVALTYGNGVNGEFNMIVDTNNNYDFSDDPVFRPVEIAGSLFHLNKDSLMQSSAIDVSTERIINGEITTESVPLLIIYMPEYKQLLYSFAQYGQVNLEGKEIAIKSNNFMDLSFENIHLAMKNVDISQNPATYMENIIANNEYLQIGNKIYKNLGVRKNENSLVLEIIDKPKGQIYSSQIGYKALEFKGRIHQTENRISLSSLHGKYVLLDFWATSCAPCIKEFPHLKELYSEIDTTKFEILGIAGNSSIDQINYIINKHQISWPQIVSDNINKINEKYGIISYPKTLLLNPEGVIIAKDLRGQQLENEIKRIIK